MNDEHTLAEIRDTLVRISNQIGNKNASESLLYVAHGQEQLFRNIENQLRELQLAIRTLSTLVDTQIETIIDVKFNEVRDKIIAEMNDL